MTQMTGVLGPMPGGMGGMRPAVPNPTKGKGNKSRPKSKPAPKGGKKK